MILFDSDVMIDILRQYPTAITWLNSIGDEELALPGFVAMELLQGCKSKAEQTKVEQILVKFEVVWLSPENCQKALEIFSLYHLSYNVGLLDALIGQTAIALNLPLYTFNRKHYMAIPNLTIIAPYTK